MENTSVPSSDGQAGPSDSPAGGAGALAAQVAAARDRAGQYFAEKRYEEARRALEEADLLEAGGATGTARARLRSFANVRAEWRTVFPKASAGGAVPSGSPVDRAITAVSLYSKFAAAVGLLPGGLMNFAAVLVVQVAMVWKISRIYGQTQGRDRIRGSILSLIGAAVPTSLGHSVWYAVGSIPAVILGTVLYFVVTPVLAFAMTQAVGKAFVMHFESGGTLLTFDPKRFQEYFLDEFTKSGGKVTRA